MKKNTIIRKRTNRFRNQGRHCSTNVCGQADGQNCDYRSGRKLTALQPVQSLIEMIFSGFNRLFDRYQETLAMKTSKDNLRLKNDTGSEDFLPDGQSHVEPTNRLENPQKQIPIKK